MYRIFWTGEARSIDGRSHPQGMYMVRSGTWRGSACELFRWICDTITSLRKCGAVIPELDDRSGQIIQVRKWCTAAEIFECAASALDEPEPILLPLPTGCGICYVDERIDEATWDNLRALLEQYEPDTQRSGRDCF